MEGKMNAQFSLSIKSDKLMMFLKFQDRYKDNCSAKILQLIEEHLETENRKQQKLK